MIGQQQLQRPTELHQNAAAPAPPRLPHLAPRTEALPPGSWARILRRTVLVVSASALVSAAAAQAIMLTLSEGLNLAGLIVALALPILLGGPVLFYQMTVGERLRLANRKLHDLAFTDWLTGCLSRRAFTSGVTGHPGGAKVRPGAFFVIDADHFKAINDRHGHDRGDEVLQMIAATIMANVREGDLVGRIGGEEFGVYLEAAGPETAADIAERIRRGIGLLGPDPANADYRLSVSIGGAVFDSAIDFTELFRLADRRLYEAKQLGRNRVVLAGGDPELRAAAARPTDGLLPIRVASL